MKLTKLRLAGFKSFVDPTELLIEPGLTGVVGPNGCGKSNLLEALRWVMGETSAKSMRGTGMEDVIFAGSDTRPPRNFAEVTLNIDNRERKLPPSFNIADQIEIARRIQREAGSSYKLNGKETRARDIQTMFADLSTGAHSPAFLRQGQIAQIISSKPAGRRQILEEAAGISGLYSRRHEAELRLKAAEQNLERLEDVTQQLDSQLQSLKRQARQATRYKTLSSHIRRADAMLLHLRYTEAAKGVQAAEASLTAAKTAVAEATQKAAAAAQAEIEAGESLPPLREEHTVASAVLQRLKLEGESLHSRESEASARIEQLETALEQLNQDLEREESLVADAGRALTDLKEEAASAPGEQTGPTDAERAANAEVETAKQAVAEAEAQFDALTQTLADQRARNSALTRVAEDAAKRRGKLEADRQRADADLASLPAGTAATGLSEMGEVVQTARAGLDASEQAAEAADAERTRLQRLEAEAREAMQDAEREQNRLRAEAKGLRSVLGKENARLFPPVIDSLTVSPGYEKALGAALGEDLEAPLDGTAPRFWDTLDPYAAAQPLPVETEALSAFVSGTPALARRLEQIGVVADEATGAALAGRLLPGQRLVSQSGALWRWDGFTMRADAPTAAAARLEQRNRLAEIETALAGAETRATETRTRFQDLKAAAKQAVQADTEARASLRRAQNDLAQAERAEAQAEKAANSERVKAETLRQRADQLAKDLAEALAAETEANQALAALETTQAQEAEIAAARERVEALRSGLSEKRALADTLRREREAAGNRAKAVARDLKSWTERAETAQGRIIVLRKRIADTDADLETARALPGELAEKRAALASQLQAAETRAKTAADALYEGERKLAEITRSARTLEGARGEAREVLARAEGTVTGAHERVEEVKARIQEAMQCEPGEVLAAAEIPPEEEMPPVADVEARLERLKRERESMGAVNLRAEEEMRAIEERAGSIATEREDLVAAINKLRHAIGMLNKEGREKMLQAFHQVNDNFTRLFTKMFHGGTAKLEMVDSDDPLEAGLEILAQPPGKKTRAMSLLSGGEQALTAISLIFSVFITNPSPICVLDEADAALDDANTERYCNLLDEIARVTDTRFLVITHHPLTMSRMDRLFGVTMAERGVSQLVSVDLKRAEEIIAA